MPRHVADWVWAIGSERAGMIEARLRADGLQDLATVVVPDDDSGQQVLVATDAGLYHVRDSATLIPWSDVGPISSVETDWAGDPDSALWMLMGESPDFSDRTKDAEVARSFIDFARHAQLHTLEARRMTRLRDR